MESSKKSGKVSILAVAHDAGGAQIVAYYLAKHADKSTLASAVIGPAKDVFVLLGLESTIITSSEKNIGELIAEINPDVLLTGTSWTTDYELRAIKKAKELGIPSVTYLEHWVHYKERFGFPRENWKENLPEELWVGDKKAEEMANSMDFGKRVVYIENEYFNSVKVEYNNYCDSAKSEEETILFISEPMSESINSMGDSMDWKFTEYNVLENVLKRLIEKNYKGRVVIRMHPAEDKEKYKEVIERSGKGLKIEVSNNKNFYADIYPAKLVIGMESMGLVIPYLCGKRTISYLPNEGQECPLPFEKIEKVKKIEEINL